MKVIIKQMAASQQAKAKWHWHSTTLDTKEAKLAVPLSSGKVLSHELKEKTMCRQVIDKH